MFPKHPRGCILPDSESRCQSRVGRDSSYFIWKDLPLLGCRVTLVEALSPVLRTAKTVNRPLTAKGVAHTFRSNDAEPCSVAHVILHSCIWAVLVVCDSQITPAVPHWAQNFDVPQPPAPSWE